MASTGWRTYHRATRSATYGFLSALPLFVLYETMIVLVNLDATRPVRVEAGVWIKELLMMTGASGGLVLALLVAGGGGAAYLLDRHRTIPLRGRYFMGLVGESAAYAIGGAAAVSSAVGALFAAVPPPDGALWTQLALSIGAGLYEELVFRVLLVGGLALLLRRLLESSVRAYVLAALLGAALFSLAHYVGPVGDPFALPSFTFRLLFGLVLNALFLWRGFGVAAWTHALYDVMVVTGLLG
ncbi:CPBP family glutamic-type intramembrane protease [Salinibacter altiplanensis]|uniref:CPBP family glutamic-type intramembrane protease n=1 Tax=Salinibacter altiplanensis TaxID=1803181 RepID=UPI000C9F43FA|nr:CPBP family glutamic-type intramembrane protease [Salinibacter altiplanensis]